MRWLFAVQEHLLGLIERCPETDPAREREVVASQRRELARIEEYYLRTAAKSGRIVCSAATVSSMKACADRRYFGCVCGM